MQDQDFTESLFSEAKPDGSSNMRRVPFPSRQNHTPGWGQRAPPQEAKHSSSCHRLLLGLLLALPAGTLHFRVWVGGDTVNSEEPKRRRRYKHPLPASLRMPAG